MLLKQKDQTEKEHIALLEAKIDHLLSDQEVKNAIILVSHQLEKMLDVLSKMMAQAHNINNKRGPIIQTTLALATKCQQIKHERRYLFRMMSIQEKEEYQRPEFLFG